MLYSATTGTLTFSPGQTTKTITVPITGDSRNEADETFFVNLSNATNTSIADGQGQGTITDNDSVPTLSINNVTVVEGTGNTQNAVFTVTLSAPSGQPVTVDFATADGSAIVGADFIANAGTLTFAAEQTTQTVTVAVNGDAIFEGSESYFVNLNGATNATISNGHGEGTITDNDLPSTLSIDDLTVTEGTGNTVNAVFTVRLSTASVVPVTVIYTTANSTALNPDDYTVASGSLTFPAGETSQTITVPVVGDSLDELTETFFVNLSSATNASITDNQGACTILDDDLAPALSVSDVTVTEGTGSTAVVAVFMVSLSEASGLPVKVAYATASGTAGSGDYLSKKGTLLFAAGQINKTISISVVGDKFDELDETFFMNLSGPLNATIADNQGECTIIDNDAAPTLTIDNKTVTEGTGRTVNAVFKVRLSAVSGLPVTVDYATEDNSAGASSDYTSVSNSLTFAPGQTSKTITVPVTGDALDELNETFVLNLTSPTNATIAVGQGLGTITDNDPTPKLSIENITVQEGNSGTVEMIFKVKLSAASGLPVTVSYATANGTATDGNDYTSTSGSLTFDPGETTKTITVLIIGDLIHEQLTKTFSLNLSNALNALFASSKGIGTILDNE